ITLYQEPAFGLWPILNSRSKVYLTSLGLSSLPFENLIPLRVVNVLVLPPSVGFGMDVARSGTSFVPSVPPTRLKATSPSCEKIRSCHSCSVALVSCSAEPDGAPLATDRKVPPAAPAEVEFVVEFELLLLPPQPASTAVR